MSNKRNERHPRRQGSDSDHFEMPEPDYFQRQPSQPRATADSPPVEAEVLWFNVQKGFGFVKLPDGASAFLHVSAIEKAGHHEISEGMKLVVRVEPGQKGPQVAEVMEGSRGSSADVTWTERHPVFAPDASSAGSEVEGTVKRYDPDRGFGFISYGGPKDAFVHASTLRRCGLDALQEGQRVIVEVVQGHKGPEVRDLRLA
jgi:CspA family cold shock protein